MLCRGFPFSAQVTFVLIIQSENNVKAHWLQLSKQPSGKFPDMASPKYVFSFQEGPSHVSPASTNPSLCLDVSPAMLNGNNVPGSENLKEIDIHKQSLSIKGGSKTAASRRSQTDTFFSALSDKKLEKMTMKQLNRYIQGIPKRQAQKLKKRRRILKNRKYALKCRLKSTESKAKIQEENASLEKDISATRVEIQRVLSERDYFKSKYLQLQTDLE